MADHGRLQQVARALLPRAVGLGVTDPRGDHPAFPGETATGLPQRLAEFRAGRAALRLAMAEIGLPPLPVPMGEDRAPVWPPGMIGSISHSADLCLAAVTVPSPLRGIGVDLEPALPLDPALRPVVLRAEEQGVTDHQAKLVFAAKEAAYKAQYGISRTLFDFHVLSVRLEDGRFEARFREEITPFPSDFTLRGRWAEIEGHFLCVVTL
ncbi:4'-phosphopantetheinyl transferase family protein [Gemmobacter caeruleus]|uniref:4'-phosphopantetheinyl transferase family protein n=1 Tax=Gemmobacter caeruleus TaxID=2595004 RepID=UPI001396885F|nr:4'-phosphopantetheinyl transferase superfamily protein [Gemmobacter caeruleus]